jgi:cytochrome oxidase Cu insertion factor (SCO1/SenC/PrrC family)
MKFEATEGLFSHNLRTLIIDTNGRLRLNIPAGGNLADTIAKEVLAAAITPQSPPPALISSAP